MATALVEYGSSGEEDEIEEKENGQDKPQVDYSESSDVLASLRERFSMNSAPVVPNKVSMNVGINQNVYVLLQEPETNLLRIDMTTKEVMYNPTYDQLFAPEVYLPLIAS